MACQCSLLCNLQTLQSGQFLFTYDFIIPCLHGEEGEKRQREREGGKGREGGKRGEREREREREGKAEKHFSFDVQMFSHFAA